MTLQLAVNSQLICCCTSPTLPGCAASSQALTMSFMKTAALLAMLLLSPTLCLGQASTGERAVLVPCTFLLLVNLAARS